MIECIECGYEIPVNGVEQGEVLECNDCGAELEVRAVNPVQVSLAPEVKEDWGE